MFAIRTENQTEKIALVHVFSEALVGKFGDLIRLQIENCDRLHRHGFLSAIAIVQERRVASVRAERDGGGKAVGGSNSAGNRNRQALAGGQRDRPILGLGYLREYNYNLRGEQRS